MAQFTAAHIRALEQAGGVGKFIKLGDKIYSGDEYVDFVKNFIISYHMDYLQKTINISGRNVHEFLVKIKAPETRMNAIRLKPEYEVDLAS